MQLKRSNSVLIEPHGAEDIKISFDEEVQVGPQSDIGFTNNSRNRQRVPPALRSVIREKMSQQRSVRSQQQEPFKKSKIGSAIRGTINKAASKIKDTRLCEICQSQILKPKNKKQVHLTECEHKRNYCQSCLHHYAIYKVKNFQEVQCPNQECNAKLQINSSFFKTLPLDIQKNYKKVHQFFMVAKDPNLRICPRQICEGTLRKMSQTAMTCDSCHNSFCPNCLLATHDGDCDTHELQYFESNLHYRQCKKCKFIISKDQGCNHMTCRCGHTFCYVCGDKWSSIHYNNHDENGRPVNNEGEQQEEDCDCLCLNQCCGQTVAGIIKLPLKFILILLFLPLMLLIWLSRDLIVIVGLFIVSIIAGLFGFSFELLCKQEGLWCVLGVLFFPVVMILGIGVGFREVFCDVVPDMFDEFCTMLCQGLQGICNI